MAPRLLAATTSHKTEPLGTVIEVFGRLGLRDIELNLHHVLELGEAPAEVRRMLEAAGVRAWVLAGGWCDFFHPQPAVRETFASIARQVELAEFFGVDLLRVFFGRLRFDEYSADRRAAIVENLTRLSDRHPAITFVFENHDGASLVPDVCRDVLARVDRPNIRMNFDPINFVRGGAGVAHALALLQPFIAHVHLKGLEQGDYCEFGVGDVDLAPMLRGLCAAGYGGSFSVEYEGRFDKTTRLYQSMRRARAALETAGF